MFALQKPAARRGAARAKGGKLRKIEDRPAWFRQEVVVDAEGNAEEGGAQEDTLGSLGFIGQPGPLPRNSYAAGCARLETCLAAFPSSL